MTALALIFSRDLKPANILVSSTGVCKIADFGTSILTEDGVIPQTDIRGTPAFMAPELFDPKLGYYNGFATDVYSLGECAGSMHPTGAGSADESSACMPWFVLAYSRGVHSVRRVARGRDLVLRLPLFFPPRNGAIPPVLQHNLLTCMCACPHHSQA